MIVNWCKKNAGLKTIPVPNKDGKIEKTLVFLPGFNEISDADWEMAKNNEIIALQIEKGYFKEIAEKKEVVKEDKDGSEKKVIEVKSKAFKDIDANDALAVVADTYDLNTLEKWRKAENRDEIRAALANQIELVNRGGKDNKDK